MTRRNVIKEQREECEIARRGAGRERERERERRNATNWE
jgi:hypothetical protein